MQGPGKVAEGSQSLCTQETDRLQHLHSPPRRNARKSWIGRAGLRIPVIGREQPPEVMLAAGMRAGPRTIRPWVPSVVDAKAWQEATVRV